MRRLSVVVAAVLVARTAHADSSLAIDAKDLPVAVTGLVEHHDEPVGLVAVGDSPALGLVNGDIVRAINGHTATRMSLLVPGGAIFYLDVTRGGAPLVVRIAVKLGGDENVIPRDRYKDQVDQLQRIGADLIGTGNRIFTQITKDGKPSGVMVRHPWFGFGMLFEGDVIRELDGVEIDTVEQALTAFARAKKNNSVAITIDRLDQRLVKTLKIDDSALRDPTIAKKTTQDWIAMDSLLHDPAAAVAPPSGTVRVKVTSPISWTLSPDTGSDSKDPKVQASAMANIFTSVGTCR